MPATSVGWDLRDVVSGEGDPAEAWGDLRCGNNGCRDRNFG